VANFAEVDEGTGPGSEIIAAATLVWFVSAICLSSCRLRQQHSGLPSHDVTRTSKRQPVPRSDGLEESDLAHMKKAENEDDMRRDHAWSVLAEGDRETTPRH